MITKEEFGITFLLVLMVLEDLQLTYFSWNPKLFPAGSGYHIVQYFYNPLFWVADNLTIVLYAISFALLAGLIFFVAFCTTGLVKARLKATWPLMFLRLLTLFAATFQFTPIMLAFAQPLICDPNGEVHGFAGVLCNSSARIGLLAASGVAAVLLTVYALVMSRLYFQPSPNSKTGKTTGRVEALYVLIKVTLILINIYTDVKASSIITCILVGLLTLYMLFTQPFYETVFNRVRFGMFFSSWIVSICSIGGAFADLRTGSTSALIPYTAVTIAVGLAAIPAGIYLCRMFTRSTVNSIYERLQAELQHQKEEKLGDVRIHKSQLDLIYSNMTEVINVKAKTHEVTVFPDSMWAEFAARFVRESYLDDKAVTLALQIFEVAFEQFPKSAYVCYLVF
jgi:hypothetical protein